MQTAQTPIQWRSRAIGAIIVTGFGALWLLLGLYVREQLNAANAAWIAGGVLALASACMHVLRGAEPTPAGPDDPQRGRAFHLINAGQWIAIFLVLTVLRRLHLDVYGITAIAVIVGLHFFPLARLFRNPLHYVTGSLMVAWAACVARLVPHDTMQGITALGAGAILWLSAAVTLAFAAYAVRAARGFREQPRIA